MGKASRRKKIDPSKREKFRPLIPFVDRPFEGLTIERDLVAMRELIPCAVLPAKTNSDNGSSEFDFVTLLPDGMGLNIDPTKNNRRSSKARDIATNSSTARIFVIPTNEEFVIANDTYKIVSELKK